TITKPPIGFLQFGYSKEVYEHDIIHIHDNISAVIYRNDKKNGTIKTLEITDGGQTINFIDPNLGKFIFDYYNCNDPDIINIAGNTYAIVYRDENDYGVLATVEIFDNGTITQQLNDTFSFDPTNKCFNPQFFHISNNTYGIIYYDDKPAGDGFITTIEISDTGVISNQVNDTQKFEDDYCIEPYITYLYDDYYSIAYQASSDNDGACTTIKINSSGIISDDPPKKLIFTDADKNYFAQECHLTHVANDIVAIVFSSGSHGGQPHQGHLVTFNSNADGDPINPLPPTISEPYDSGIYKEDSYGIHLNSKYLAASIGNDFFIKQINITSDWQHVVLTFDGYNVSVYLNGVEEITGISTDGIPSDPTKNILFGNSFFGYIDEIAILNRILTDSEITNWTPRIN
ncbi:MAG: LamG domain-containing protein, partial [Thermoplasmatales archaeon]|nr:LamG domain-containing protein [Thermoplasmatales archaeon]